jgi:hypothetical protein
MNVRSMHNSPRRRIARRVAAAGMALAAVLTLGACKSTGGGYVGTPLDGGPVSDFQGRANFGFNFTCEMETVKKKKRAVIKGQITYHDNASTVGGIGFPEIRIHGIVEPIVILNVSKCGEAVEELFGYDPSVGSPFEGIPTALFEGTYRSQDTTVGNVLPPGEFSVLVGDQGEPARPGGDFTGDLFSIELFGGPYAAYTRGGYIEGGNIQVEK